MSTIARILFASCLAVSAAPFGAQAQTVLWSKAGGNGSVRASAGMTGYFYTYNRNIAVDAAGDVFVAGQRFNGDSLDFVTSKYRATDGALLWSRTWNGPGNQADIPFAIAVDGAGHVIVTGEGHNGKNTDFRTIKYAGADGTMIWERSFNGPDDRSDTPVDVAVDPAGHVVVTGSSARLDGRRSLVTIKYAANDGATVWQRTQAGATDEDHLATALAIDGAGDVVVTGSVEGFTGGWILTIKQAAADGATRWERTTRGPYPKSRALVLDAAGNALVVGVDSSITGTYRIFKHAAADGAELWSKSYAGTYASGVEVTAATVNAAGDLIVAGWARRGFDIDWETVKYQAGDGDIAWARTNGTSGQNFIPHALAVDAAGDVTVVGYTIVPGQSRDFLTIKYAGGDGTPIWQRTFDGPSNQNDEARAVALDAAGNAFVAGHATDSPVSEIRVLKYAASDGTTLWTASSPPGPMRATLGSPDRPGRGIARDPDGNLVMLGATRTAGFPVIRLLKRAMADGAVMWERTIDLGGDGDNVPVAVSVDASGGIVVVATTSVGGIRQYRTFRFAADGSGPLWQRSYTSGFGQGSIPSALALDAAGNAVVTGYSDVSGSSFDFKTLKYSVADGAVLWERSFASPGLEDDVPFAIAVDAIGDVIVTGQAGSGSAANFRTIKYASADGVTLWERGYGGPANLADIARAVATDGARDVIVTGTSDTGGGTEVVTIRYAADGTPRWTGTFAGTPGRDSTPTSVAVDRAGNVLVTGYGGSSNFRDQRYQTFKLAAADGATLWSANFEAGPEGDHRAFALAVDGAGNAIVTGASHDGYVSGFRTIKYRGGDGSVAWNHVANPGVFGQGLAVLTLPGAAYAAGDCVVDAKPAGLCAIRFENKSAALMRLAAPSDSILGQPVTFDASSSVAADPDAPLAGTFTFRDGATVLCSGPAATCTVASLSLGAHAITVTFEGTDRVEATTTPVFAHGVYATPAGIPRLVNLATRVPVLIGDNVLIGGFIIGGTQAKTVVIRARGPSLSGAGVAGALANPLLQLFAGASQVAVNDNWGDAANATAIQASGFAPGHPLESAILVTLAPGAYTAIVTGAGGATGVGLIEVFEVDLPEIPLVNIATRGVVLSGDNVMIGGFVIQGDPPCRVA